MTRPRLVSLLALVAGLAVLALILAQADPADLWHAVAAAGWGVLAVSVYRFLPIACDAAGWARLFPAPRPTFLRTLRDRWIGESVNSLLPVAQVGGDVARARLIRLGGVAGGWAGASVVVDFTVGLAAQLAFTVVALIPLAGTGDATGAVLSVLAAAALIAGFVAAQRAGGLSRIGQRLGPRLEGLAAGVADVEARMADLYRDRKALAGCFAWRFGGWFVRAGETAILLWFMGQPVGVVAVLAVEALGQAARSAAFLIPGAVGVQEGGIVAAGLLAGLDLETALALAVARRARELLNGLPGLLAWMLAEREGLSRWVGKGAS
ncbi:MAG: flippase-like domain-containing protein [Rhodobacterales bacterium]|nr:flippase-like domain-containing protein [Rhodobacterales bacterium]